MTNCLIALGSNLGDRRRTCCAALAELARLPRTRVLARSAWRQTEAVGGPTGQRPFLNGAVLASTGCDPPDLMAALLDIERRHGRVRERRWDARTIDLDVLLYGDREFATAELAIPHPRMHFRQFVLAGAAEAAPWMVHPSSRWTLAALRDQLEHGADVAAVAAADPYLVESLVAALRGKLDRVGHGEVSMRPWDRCAADRRPKLILAVGGAAGGQECAGRKMLQLPATGPVAWLDWLPSSGSLEDLTDAAASAMASAWPGLTRILSE